MNPRPGGSPLIDPIACSVLLLVPNQGDLSSLNSKARQLLQGNLATLVAAANILQVPVFTHTSTDRAKDSATAQPPLPHPHRIFFHEQGVPWSNNAFIDALTKENRSTLVLAGVWLEHQVLTTALHALADAYHVYFLVDATFARTQSAQSAARERLVQAGATPIVVSQVIHEWCLEAPDPTTKAALVELLAPVA